MPPPRLSATHASLAGSAHALCQARVLCSDGVRWESEATEKPARAALPLSPPETRLTAWSINAPGPSGSCPAPANL